MTGALDVVGAGLLEGGPRFLLPDAAGVAEDVTGGFLLVLLGTVSSSLDVADAVVFRVSTRFSFVFDGGSGFFALELVVADS